MATARSSSPYPATALSADRRAPGTARHSASRVAAAAALLLAAGAARADIFSPGELSNAHKQLEGIKNCTQCHVAGQQLSAQQCLTCHGEIKATLDAQRGLHGKLGADERASCQSCHHEHQGRDFAIVDFGEGGPKSFDHGRTAFSLQGAHAKVDCAKCHDNRLVRDDVVKKLLTTKSPAKTFLGLGTSCTSCHADEHRGQLGTDCLRCHTERFWEPAQKFDHGKAAFKLRGPHAAAACTACHKSEPDAQARAFPAPVHPEFMRFKPVAHESCAACHKDPHEGRFGADCASCHVEAGWKEQKAASGGKGPRAFHAKTAFPLRGAHEEVACKQCHGPFADGRPAKFKGLAHDSCSSCHADAHAGQLRGDCAGCHGERTFAASSFDLKRHAANFPLEGKHADAKCGSCHVKDAALRSRSKQVFRLDGTTCAACHADAHAGATAGDCKACHTAASFQPARFEAEDHTRWPLSGAHGAVACVLCHAKDDKLLAKVKQQKKKPGRGPWLVRASLANLRPVEPQAGCQACHQDPHRGKFGPEQTCASCHTTEHFSGAKFEHGKTGFPLEGKHAAAACAACHGSETRFNKVDPSCAACHAEPHAGQLGDRCARCHSADAWDPTHFAHESVFKLEGRHAALACETCHPKAQVAPGVKAALYRPRPRDCEGCHADFHRGAFERWAP